MCQPSLPFKCSYQMGVPTSTSLSPYLNHHVEAEFGMIFDPSRFIDRSPIYVFLSNLFSNFIFYTSVLSGTRNLPWPSTEPFTRNQRRNDWQVLFQFSSKTLHPSRYHLVIINHFKCPISIKPKGGKYHYYCMLQKKNSDQLRQSYCNFGEWMLNLSEHECTVHCKSLNVFCSWRSYGTITSTLSKQN